MPPSNHSMLGASSSHRWLECTPSAAWERQFPDSTSEAAAEGTLAHAIAEARLTDALDGRKPETPAMLAGGPLYKRSMDDYVDVYVDYIMGIYTEASTAGLNPEVLLEQRLDYSRWVPGGFGTGDCVMIAGHKLHVFDFKFGKGVPVDAVGNPQLRLYALGAWDAYAMLYDITDVSVHIIQPRLDMLTSEELTLQELLDWADNYVAPRARLAAEGRGEFNAGEWCRFCRAKAVCRTYADSMIRINQIRFDSDRERKANELTPAEISEILSKVDGLSKWANAIKEYALTQATTNEAHFPGYKLVLGRSNRRISDEDAAMQAIINAGYSPWECTKLVGIGELEEILGKERFESILGGLVVKPEGKPTLAKATDKRPEYNPLNDIFSPLADE